MKTIKISSGSITVSAELFDTSTAETILQALPIEGAVNTWGDEIYFEIPLQIALEPEARADVEVGELGYWPTGSAFCIFFGPTPMSAGEKPRAASAVNVFGRIVGDCAPLKSITGGSNISVTKE